jgi:hypothetical protein
LVISKPLKNKPMGFHHEKEMAKKESKALNMYI